MSTDLISLLEDDPNGGATCCCDNTEDCCWNKCYDTTGLDADQKCKEEVEKGGVKFNHVYWAPVNLTNYNILVGQRIKVKIGKFYT